MAKKYNAFPAEAQALLDGLLFGFGDEALAAGSAIFEDVSYEEALEANRKAARDYAKDNPGKQIGLEIVGSLPYMFLPGGVARTATLLGKVARGAVTGGAAGAAAGFGEGEGGFAKRTGNAALGAIGGGVVGGSIPAVGRVAEMGVKKVLGQPLVEQGARRALKTKIEESGRTVAGMQDELRDMTQDAINKPITLAELSGENALNVLDKAANREGRAMDRVRSSLMERRLGRRARINQDVHDALGARENFYDELDDILAARRSQADPLYREAYALPQRGTERVEDLIYGHREDFERAWPKARDLLRRAMRQEDSPIPMRELPEKLFDAETGALAVDLDVAMMDYLQRGLGDFVSDRTTGTGPQAAGQLGNLRQRLSSLVEDLAVSDDGRRVFGEARAVYAGSKAAEEALISGRAFLRQDPEEVTRALRRMSATERDAYVTGATRAISDAMGNRADPATAIAFRGDKMENIQALANGLADSPERAAAIFKQLSRRINWERRMSGNEQRVMGNSASARRLADLMPQEGAAAAEIASVAATGGALPGMGIAAHKASKAVKGAYDDAVNDRMVEMLLEANPEARSAILRALAGENDSAIGKAIDNWLMVGGGSVGGQNSREAIGLLK